MSRTAAIAGTLTLLVLLVADAPRTAFAQRTGGTTAGATTTTGGATSATGGATSGATGGTGGSNFSYGLGASGTGGATAGSGGVGGGLAGPAFVEVGSMQTAGATGAFVGRAMPTEFIGAGQRGAGTQTTRQGQFGQGGQFGNFGQFGGGAGRGGGQQRGGLGSTSTLSRAERLRPRHRIAFDFAPVTVDVVRTNLQTRFLPTQNQLGGIDVDVDAQGRAILRGTAVSEDARKLAEALARLEPGVRKVTNEIDVAGGD